MASVELMTQSISAIPNVLAERYASREMRRIWSREEKIRLERNLWIAVMKAQSKHRVPISPEEISRYEAVVDVIDLGSIDDREHHLRHDVKARIEEFNSLTGLQLIHLGMTSRDLTENVELVQVRNSLNLIRSEVVGILNLLADRMNQYSDLVLVGRSHNVPAQLTTFGKRLATVATELFFALERLDSLISRLPLRGLRGPVGTGQDLLDLVGDDANLVENEIAQGLGFNRILSSTGQIYPRSIDFEVISTLVQLASAPSNFATLTRLMSGQGLMSEGFKEGQVGSSAMPHKINARSSERINGLAVVLKGYLSMASEMSGVQWNEGDVSCSVVRRVALPDAFFTLDGIFQTMATVMSEMVLFEEAIAKEVERELPFTSTTRLLMEAVKRGIGREDAHKIIQRHSLSALEKSRKGEDHSFFYDIGADIDLPISRDEALGIAVDHTQLIGHSKRQVEDVLVLIASLGEVPSLQFEQIR
jgi:adenylosuccinate lyase